MHTLPPAMILLLRPFALLFSKRVWLHAQVLLAGVLLAPAQRTVTAALRAQSAIARGAFCSARFARVATVSRTASGERMPRRSRRSVRVRKRAAREAGLNRNGIRGTATVSAGMVDCMATSFFVWSRCSTAPR